MVGAGGFTVGLTGTIGFSVSVFGTGGQTRFSNLTVLCLSIPSSPVGVVTVLSKSVGGCVRRGFGLDSHIFLKEDIDPVDLRLSSNAAAASESVLVILSLFSGGVASFSLVGL